MAAHSKELQDEHDQLVDRVEDAMGQIYKYDAHLAENHIQYAVEDILERLAQATAAQGKAEFAAHVHSKSASELAQTLETERQLRRETERCHETALEMARDRGERLKEAEQRAERAEAANDHLRSVASQVPYLKDRVARAEALAALVNEETVAPLEMLADFACIWGDRESPGDWGALGDSINTARTLAARIREALVEP